MIIKKFTGKTEKEATDAAKKELGDGIVVMNVRPVKKYGFFAFLRAPQTEVTVALEDEEERSGTTITPQEYAPLEPYRDKVQPKESAASQISKAALDGKIPPLRVSEDRPKSALESLAASAKETETETYQPSEEAIQMKKSLEAARAASNVSALSTPAPSSAISEQKAAQIEEKIDSLHDLLEKKIIKEESKSLFPVDAQKDKDNAALKEKEEKDQVEEETMNFVKVLYNTLLENEVNERYANQLTDEIGKVNKPGLPLEYALSNVYQKMVLKFGNPETITENAGKVRAEIFIGPTGVGKTTTIAKLASQLIITKKKKVALLTVDTYRIAATDQLKTYASILDIPFRVIYSTDEMLQALGEKDGYVGINYNPGFLSDDFGKDPREAALLDEGEKVEEAFIQDPGNAEKVKAWLRMQERLKKEIRRPGVKEIADHIDHAVKWAGIDHVGIGSDFDGILLPPADVENIGQSDVLWEELRRRGYSQEQSDKISGANLMEVWKRVIKCSE